MGGGRGTARPPSDCDKWNKFTDPTVHYNGPPLSLPLPAGYGWKVNTNPGFYTPDVQFHSGWYFHAIDFGDNIFINGKLNDFDENVIDVLAAADGKVSFVENSLCANGGSNAACKLFVNHSYSTYGTGYETEYTHVVKGSIKVSVGERVKRGQVLAKLGKTGTGRVHLHFSLRHDNCSCKNDPYLAGVILEDTPFANYVLDQRYLSKTASPSPLAPLTPTSAAPTRRWGRVHPVFLLRLSKAGTD